MAEAEIKFTFAPESTRALKLRSPCEEMALTWAVGIRGSVLNDAAVRDTAGGLETGAGANWALTGTLGNGYGLPTTGGCITGAGWVAINADGVGVPNGLAWLGFGEAST